MSTSTDTPADPIAQVAKDAEREQTEARAQANATASAASDAKPKRTRGGKRAGAGRPKAASEAAQMKDLSTRLAELFALLGAGVMAFNAVDGIAIVTGGPNLADALTALAKENPAVRRALLGLLQTSAWGGVIMAAAPIALTIAGNHGALPPQLAAAFGGPEVSTPDAAADASSNGAGPRLVG